MTFPSYRHLLDLRPQPRHPELGDGTPIQPFGFVARKGDAPAGLAIGERPVGPGGESPQLLSVFVQPAHRRLGVAGALVAAIEDEARRQGGEELTTVYTTGKPAIDWMERIFTRRRWQPPEPGSMTVRLRPRSAFASPAFSARRLRAYGRGLEIFPWSELTAEEEAEMRRSNRERRWIEPSLEPWQTGPESIDPSSVGARFRGRVVGWVLNHRVVPGLVRFSISFMHRDLSRRGRILPLYHASLRRVEEAGPDDVCTFITPFSYPRMVTFIRRWIAPIATFVGESKIRRISLRPARS